MIRPLLFGEEKATLPPDFAATNDANKDGMLQLGEIPETWVEKGNLDKVDDDITFRGEDLRRAFDRVDADGSGGITRAEWRAAQAHDWKHIWKWPAIMAGVTCLMFWLGFHDRVAETEPPRGEPA
jgi:hypothetical protein